MKIKQKLFCCLTGFLMFTGNIFPENTVMPVKERDEIIIFDANKNNMKDFINYTSSWRKGSDMMPQLSLAEKDNGKWIKFSYKGSSGSGISLLHIIGVDFNKMMADEMIPTGIKLLIDYEGVEFEKIEVKAIFSGENDFEVYHVPLERGVREYTLTKGFRKADFSADWTKLKSICLRSRKPRMTFALGKIAVLQEKSNCKDVALRINSLKKIQEILPSKSEILKNGVINEDSLNGAIILSDFYSLKEKRKVEAVEKTFRAKITYDENNLCIGTEAEFPEKPVSNVKKKDDDVFQDEAQEYFFSSWNDNNKKIQFVTNFNGTVFDALKDYDLTAAAVINSVEWDLPHIKNISYANGIWKTLFAVSLKDLNMDLNKCRFMGFQLAQSYKSGKYKTQSWTPSSRFPNPFDFGVLIFNKKPFGDGDIEITEILRRKKSGGNEIDLDIKILGKNFKEEEYKVETIIVASDYTSVKSEETIKLSQKTSESIIKINSIKNLNGDYTVYVCVYNKNNDMKIASVNFENATPLTNIFGENVLCPTPKEVIWGEGFFMSGNADKILISDDASERTIKTANMFKDKLSGFAGSEYSISKSSTLQKNSISLKIAKQTELAGKNVQLREDGYSIQVRPDGVDITGADEPGLYYGCVTFLQLVKMPMKVVEGMPVKCVKILDWPDLQNRMVRIEHPWHFKGREFKDIPKIEYLMDWIERFVAENKFNRLSLDISMLVKFQRQPEFNGSERVFSLDDLRKLGKFCRAHFIEVMPVFQVGGHANLWLLGYHPELTEKGYPHQSDVTHPEHNKIVFNCIQDVIDAMNPRYFSSKSDEWWHVRDSKISPDDFMRNGKTRAQAFLDFHIELNDWLKKRNIRMFIFEDMLNPRHNGKRYDIYKVIDEFPRDIIITQWTGGASDLTAAYFLDKGFEVWGNTTAYWKFGKEMRPRIQGMGYGTYMLGTDWKIYRKTIGYSQYEIFMGADDAWNILGKEPDIMSELASGRLSALREMYALKPNPSASPKVETLDIQQYMNCSAEKQLCKKGQLCVIPFETREIGNIPMILSNQKFNCIILGKDKTISIPVVKICSSLIFLHTTVGLSEQAINDFNKVGHWRNWPYGYISGEYQIHYADGAIEKLLIRHCWNICFADSNPLYRNTNDNRYIMPLETSDGGYRFLYQYEWVNPYPDKKIEKITYLDNGEFHFNILLFALSYRERK